MSVPKLLQDIKSAYPGLVRHTKPDEPLLDARESVEGVELKESSDRGIKMAKGSLCPSPTLKALVWARMMGDTDD